MRLKPISEAVEPLREAFNPITDAFHDGLGDLDLQGIVDEISFVEEFEGLQQGTSDIASGVAGLKEFGSVVAQAAADSLSGDDRKKRQAEELYEEEEDPTIFTIFMNDY